MNSYAATRDLERIRVRRPAGNVETLWDAWDLAREDAGDAYQTWSDAAAADRADAHRVYVAAADRESAAARLLHVGLDGAPRGVTS